MLHKLDDYGIEIINHYLNLNIGNKKVNCPYFRNVKRVRAELRALVGKGSPEEIEDETLIFSKFRGYSLINNTPQGIREFMESQGLGVDCSGYVAHIYDYILKKKGKGSIYKYMKFKYNSPKIVSRIKIFLRPIENISSDLITCELNTTKVNINDTRPGDLVRLKGVRRGDHVLMIYEVETDENNIVKRIKYTHSSPHYGKNNGVKFGEIFVEDINKPLEEQKWTELNDKSECPTLKGYIREVQDNGIVRPNWAKQL